MNESMRRVDLGKLEAAILYVERITEGYNPVNCEPVGEGEVGIGRRGGTDCFAGVL